MEPSPAITVALQTSDPRRTQAWSEALVAAGLSVWQPDQPGPVAVLLTDRNLGDAATPPSDWWPLHAQEDAPPGIVQVGGTGPADVVLATDATAREIGLACRLLEQLVQLRWQLHRQEQLQQRLAQEATTDPLSGLGNRRVWNQALAQLAVPPHLQPFCVAILDLDHFKQINDRYGHPTGDRVLQITGKTLRDALRGGDVVARLGGDEFGLLLGVPSADAAAAVIERVRRRLPLALVEAGLPSVTASVGYCLIERNAPSDPQTFVQAADRALHQAKQQGRDRVVC